MIEALLQMPWMSGSPNGVRGKVQAVFVGAVFRAVEPF
jgi:hypothetical protein